MRRAGIRGRTHLAQITVLVAVILVATSPVIAQGFTVRPTGDVVIPAGTTREGTIVTLNGRIQVDGTLAGDALTVNGDITVAGTVTGSVRTLNGAIVLRSTSRVDGDVRTINGRVDRELGAVVGGMIGEGWAFGRRRPRPAPVLGPGMPWASWAIIRVVAAWLLFSLVLMATAVAALFPHAINRVSTALSEAPGQALLAGILVWIGVPPLMMALAVSIVGIPALAFVPLAMSVLSVIGFAAAAMLLGERITDGFRWHIGPVADAVVGSVILALLTLAPVFGWLALLMAVTWGVGGVLLAVFRRGGKTSAPTPQSARS